MEYKLLENNLYKLLRSEEYNYNFDKRSGYFQRWGKDKNHDPQYSCVGPELADMEISTVCSGLNNKPCSFCYKSNTPVGQVMTLETFKAIHSKLPRTLTQIAFGIGNVFDNEEMFKIFEYCRSNEYNQVIPNVTTNGWGLTDEIANRLVKLCGAVAVSCYEDHNVCYDAVERLTNLGLRQTNIHMLVSSETFDRCLQLMKDSKTDPRLAKLNAIVFLSLKPKGKRNKNSALPLNKFIELVNYALENQVSFGFDSCSAGKVLKAIEGRSELDHLRPMIEPCESFGMFSAYINVEGKYFPCSFAEGEGEFKEGIDLLQITDFNKEVWNSPLINKHRNNMCDRFDCKNFDCPLFEV